MFKKTAAFLLALAMVFTLVACQETAQPEPAETPAVDAPTDAPTQAPVGAAGYTAGTYTASAPGQNGDVNVSVTFAEDAITEIAVLENIETPGVGTWPIEIMPKRIIESQSLAVDTVSGASITSRAILSAVEDCAEQAGGDVAALKAELPAEPVQDIEKTADVIIVGGGGAGLAAAVAATDEGSSVILIEKTGFLGGNSVVSGGIYNCPDPELQEPQGIEDSVELFIKQTWEGGDKVADIDLVTTLCTNSYDSLVWLESMGMEFRDDITQGVGALHRRTHTSVLPNGTGFIKTFRDNLASKGALVEIMMEVSGKSIVVDDTGRVTGVIAEGKDGNAVTLTANKGVIITTGGFAANVEMRQQYCEGEKWPDLGSSLISSNMPAIQGEGIKMAEAVGAALVDMEQIQLLQVCNPWTGVTSDVIVGGVDGCIYVNQEGERFVREDGRRDVISAAILQQTGGRMYTIHNYTVIDNPDTFKNLGGRTITEMIEEGKYGFVKADTVEELAALIEVPAKALQASLDTYNAHVRNGDKVDEFGRELLVNVLEGGPWYAYPRAPAAHHTMGGIKINTSAEVIGTDGNVIPGLYAAGEVTGGIHGGNRLGGNAIVDFTVFGRIAGTSAANAQ